MQRKRLKWVGPLTAGAVVLSVIGATLPSLARAGTSPGYGVACESPTATRVTARHLANGAHAVDAVVVASLVSGVTSPTSSGIGGGGFAMVHLLDEKAPFALDFRETAPQALEPEVFEQRPLADDRIGHLVGVPGEVRGLYALHAAHGKQKWGDLVREAARTASGGFVVGRHLAEMLAYAKERLIARPGFAGLFYPGGKPALVGSRITHPALGKTLELIAEGGPQAFYEGDVARSIVSTARAAGSPMTLEDLAGYRTQQREPLTARLGRDRVYTMPPPSAGGLMMVQALEMLPLGMLEELGADSPATAHLLAESMRSSVADRMRYLSDPDHAEIPLDRLLSPARLAERAGTLSLERTHALPRFALDERGTHALVVADRAGNVVSLTTTLNHLFGAKLLDEGTGVFLNNQLDDFSAAGDVAAFGLEESPNRARAGARPVSSMTPTIVLDPEGRAVLALGGSGGTAIATNALQTLLGARVFGRSAAQAVAADRVYLPTDHRSILVEKQSSDALITELEERGEVVGRMLFSTTAIQMLQRRGSSWEGAADPRKHGVSATGP